MTRRPLSLTTCAAAVLLTIGDAQSVAAPRQVAYLVPIPIGLIEPDIPRNAPLTHEGVALGERLFFDRRLSASGGTSCGKCHAPDHGFAEAEAVSRSDNGVVQHRNAPSVLNAGFLASGGWDGRFRTLEDQVSEPFTPDGDMGIGIGAAMEVITGDAEYVRAFRVAYDSEPTAELLRRAIASYERSLVSGGTRFDRYFFGGEENAISVEAKEGLHVFLDRANCINCHDVFHPTINPLGGNIALLTDHRFHNLGVGLSGGRMRDTGRYLITADPDDWGAFKTPSLRNVELTAPYMHDGSLRTLEDVIDFYNRGGVPNRNLSPIMRPLYLSSREKSALAAFLRTLTDENYSRREETR